MTSEDFGIWLERQIYTSGLTKSSLARSLKVAPATISQWTSGETEPATDKIPLLAEALGISKYEIYLRLGRIEPRGELDHEWEIFIQKVETYGGDFKQFVLEAIDEMRHAWYLRPRTKKALMKVSVSSFYYEYPKEGLRSSRDIWQGERLFLYDAVEFSNGEQLECMISALKHDAGFTLIVRVVSDDDLSIQGTLVVNDVTYEAVSEGNIVRFPDLQLLPEFEDISLTIEID